MGSGGVLRWEGVGPRRTKEEASWAEVSEEEAEVAVEHRGVRAVQDPRLAEDPSPY